MDSLKTLAPCPRMLERQAVAAPFRFLGCRLKFVKYRPLFIKPCKLGVIRVSFGVFFRLLAGGAY